MTDKLLEKISSEASSVYAVITQHSRGNDLTLRTNLRRAVQVKLQSYVDKKLIASYNVICDESNNDQHQARKPVRLDIFIKITPSSPQYVISLPSAQPKQQPTAAVPAGNSLWSKLFGRR